MARKSILVVDDEKNQREILETILSGEGYDVTTASSGEAAMKFVEARRFDLVLTDLKMTGMSGLDLLRRIRADERTKLLPVVVFTASRQDTDVQLAYELGANSYIRKPVDFEHFAQAVQQLGLYWLILNEAPGPR